MMLLAEPFKMLLTHVCLNEQTMLSKVLIIKYGSYEPPRSPDILSGTMLDGVSSISTQVRLDERRTLIVQVCCSVQVWP